MTVSPLPVCGGVHLDPRDAGRALRISAHPESGVVTISVWRDGTCVATHQVPVADVPELVKLLTGAALAEEASGLVAS